MYDSVELRFFNLNSSCASSQIFLRDLGSESDLQREREISVEHVKICLTCLSLNLDDTLDRTLWRSNISFKPSSAILGFLLFDCTINWSSSIERILTGNILCRSI